MGTLVYNVGMSDYNVHLLDRDLQYSIKQIVHQVAEQVLSNALNEVHHPTNDVCFVFSDKQLADAGLDCDLNSFLLFPEDVVKKEGHQYVVVHCCLLWDDTGEVMTGWSVSHDLHYFFYQNMYRKESNLLDLPVVLFEMVCELLLAGSDDTWRGSVNNDMYLVRFVDGNAYSPDVRGADSIVPLDELLFAGRNKNNFCV